MDYNEFIAQGVDENGSPVSFESWGPSVGDGRSPHEQSGGMANTSMGDSLPGDPRYRDGE